MFSVSLFRAYQFIDAVLVRVEDKGRRRLVHRLDGELFVVVADVLDFRPREVDSRDGLVILLVNVQTQSRYAQPQIRVSLILESNSMRKSESTSRRRQEIP